MEQGACYWASRRCCFQIHTTFLSEHSQAHRVNSPPTLVYYFFLILYAGLALWSLMLSHLQPSEQCPVMLNISLCHPQKSLKHRRTCTSKFANSHPLIKYKYPISCHIILIFLAVRTSEPSQIPLDPCCISPALVAWWVALIWPHVCIIWKRYYFYAWKWQWKTIWLISFEN